MRLRTYSESDGSNETGEETSGISNTGSGSDPAFDSNYTSSGASEAHYISTDAGSSAQLGSSNMSSDEKPDSSEDSDEDSENDDPTTDSGDVTTEDAISKLDDDEMLEALQTSSDDDNESNDDSDDESSEGEEVNLVAGQRFSEMGLDPDVQYDVESDMVTDGVVPEDQVGLLSQTNSRDLTFVEDENAVYENKTSKNRWLKLIAGTVFVVIFIVVIVVPVLVLTKDDTLVSEDRLAKLAEYNRYEYLEDFEKATDGKFSHLGNLPADSTQTKALGWILNNDKLIDLSIDQKFERFVIAVLYYGAGGGADSLVNDYNFMTEETSICEWRNNYEYGIWCNTDLSVSDIILGMYLSFTTHKPLANFDLI
jgi:hypothetical protein